MAGFLNWGGRIALYFLFRFALFEMYPAWRMHFRIALYAIVILWVYNEFPALKRGVGRLLDKEPDESDDKDSWAELKDFATLVVGVMVVLLGSTFGQTFVESIQASAASSLIDDRPFDVLIGVLRIAGFLLTAILFVRYSWALLLGKRFVKTKDAAEEQPAEDTAGEQA